MRTARLEYVRLSGENLRKKPRLLKSLFRETFCHVQHGIFLSKKPQNNSFTDAESFLLFVLSRDFLDRQEGMTLYHLNKRVLKVVVLNFDLHAKNIGLANTRPEKFLSQIWDEIIRQKKKKTKKNTPVVAKKSYSRTT
jgi:hypothetical protein